MTDSASDTPETPQATGNSSAEEGSALAEAAVLPIHARRLLKIRVPVQVTLASQRKSIQEIVELGPGSIITFDKTYSEPLDLTVGDRPLARGEVVKVGDKFGLRIRDLVSR